MPGGGAWPRAGAPRAPETPSALAGRRFATQGRAPIPLYMSPIDQSMRAPLREDGEVEAGGIPDRGPADSEYKCGVSDARVPEERGEAAGDDTHGEVHQHVDGLLVQAAGRLDAAEAEHAVQHARG
eukprot:scaffold20768_cov118-Isochrysis_galbana.AAC.3